MMGRPLLGMAFGATAIGLALISMGTRTETPPIGYVIFDYVLLIIGGAGIVAGVIAHRRKQ